MTRPEKYSLSGPLVRKSAPSCATPREWRLECLTGRSVASVSILDPFCRARPDMYQSVMLRQAPHLRRAL